MNNKLKTLQSLIVELNKELLDAEDGREIIRLESEIDDYLHQARSLLPVECKQLHCAKCNKALTRNLREMPEEWKTALPNYTRQTHDKARWRKVGEDAKAAQYIITTKASLLEGIAQPYKQGYGCCDHDGTELLCECGQNLGHQYFDCWQGQPQMWFYKEAIK